MANKKDKKGRVLKEGEDQLKDNRYRFRYTDKFGKRHAVYSWKLTPTDKLPSGKKPCKSLREKEIEIQTDLVNGIKNYDSQITVLELVNRYLLTKTNLAYGTLIDYERTTRLHIASHRISKMLIKNVTHSDILLFYTEISEKSISTLKSVHSIINPSFKMAVRDRLLHINPCEDCMTNFKGTKKEKIPLTVTQQKSLLLFLKNDNTYKFYYTLTFLLFESGLRISEAVGLTWEDIDFTKKLINVDHQLIRKKGKGSDVFTITRTKNKSNRIVPLSENLAKQLKQYYEDTKSIRNNIKLEVDGYSNFIFYSKRNTLFNRKVVISCFTNAAKAYNCSERVRAMQCNENPVYIAQFTPHICRHTFCTRMAEKGMDVKVLQSIMGHKHLSTTMEIYNHVNENRILAEFHRVNG